MHYPVVNLWNQESLIHYLEGDKDNTEVYKYLILFRDVGYSNDLDKLVSVSEEPTSFIPG